MPRNIVNGSIIFPSGSAASGSSASSSYSSASQHGGSSSSVMFSSPFRATAHNSSNLFSGTNGSTAGNSSTSPYLYSSSSTASSSTSSSSPSSLKSLLFLLIESLCLFFVEIWLGIRERMCKLWRYLSFKRRSRSPSMHSSSSTNALDEMDIPPFANGKKMPFRHSRYTKPPPDAEMVEQALNVLQSLKEEVGDDWTVEQVSIAENLLNPGKKKVIPRNYSSASLAGEVILEGGKGIKMLASWFRDVAWALTTYNCTDWPFPLPGERAEIKRTILSSRVVREAIRSSAEIRGVDARDAAKSANQIFENMAADLRMPVVRMFGWVLRKVFRLFYPFGIRIDESEIDAVVNAARSAPIIYLPTHKSYMDFLILHFICFKYGLPLPHVFSGDNMNIPIIGRLLRYAGGFYMRRSFLYDPDPLYRTVYSEYVKQLLQRGYAIEAYIEGGRSRSGKVLMPKPGFLRTVIDSLINDEVTDVNIIPVSIDYDRIMESSSHTLELSGGTKNSEKFLSFLIATVGLLRNLWGRHLSFGHVNVSFGQPLSLQAYLTSITLPSSVQSDSSDPQAPAVSPRFTPDAHVTVRKYVSMALGFRVMYECNKIATVQPGALVGTVLLTHFGRGIRMETLIERVKWLRGEILARGGKVGQMEGNMSSVVQSVLNRVLESKERNKLVKRHKGILICSLYSPAERLELTLFRNSLIHYFVAEAIICCSMYACEREAAAGESVKRMVVTGVKVENVIQKVEYLSKLLKFEFVYKPSPGLSVSFHQTIAFMKERGVVSVNDEEGTIGVLPSATPTYMFLCSLIWPFIDGYWIVALSLFYLLPDRMVDEERLLHWQQAIGERLYFESAADLYEAVSKETLQNALSLYETWNVVHFLQIEGTQSSPGRRIVQLDEKFRGEERIYHLVQELEVLRKQTRAFRSRRFMALKESPNVLAIEAVKAAKLNKIKLEW